MKDMIERIMEMDKTAQEVTKIVQKEKLTLEQEIKALKNNIRSEYLMRARARIESNRVQEQKIADEKIDDINEFGKKVLARLEKQYIKNKDIWVNAIVTHVIGE